MDSYILESRGENDRLFVQQTNDIALQIFSDLGLSRGDLCLDAGCGVGLISRQMAGIVGPSGAVLGVDLSPERLEFARALASRQNLPVEFRQASIRRIPSEDCRFSFSWAQDVLEYIEDKEAIVSELIRVTRPKGTVVVSEIDGFGLNFWPMSAELAAGLDRLVRAVEGTGFDVYAGRKMFAIFKDLGLRDVSVRMYPRYVVAGEASPDFVQDWETRFDALEQVAVPFFGGADNYRKFASLYVDMLKDDRCLKFCARLVTSGKR